MLRKKSILVILAIAVNIKHKATHVNLRFISIIDLLQPHIASYVSNFEWMEYYIWNFQSTGTFTLIIQCVNAIFQQ